MDIPYGSLKETIAAGAISRRNTVHFITTLSIVNAIIQVGNVIAAAVSGSNPQDQNGLSKTIATLRELLFPDEVIAKENAAQRAIRLLQKEVDQGTLYAIPKTSSGRKKKGSLKR